MTKTFRHWLAGWVMSMMTMAGQDKTRREEKGKAKQQEDEGGILCRGRSE
jgi:hypothetical protein